MRNLIHRTAIWLVRHPFTIGFLAVVAAAALFRMGIFAGETLYLATDGDGVSTAQIAGIVVVPVLLVGGGVWLDRRRRHRSTDARRRR